MHDLYYRLSWQGKDSTVSLYTTGHKVIRTYWMAQSRKLNQIDGHIEKG
jgi:hypothetical protein